MEMPVITKCTVNNCAYNQEEKCHALAITIGEPAQAQCGTFTTVPVQGGDPEHTGHVGACKTADCQYNVGLECQAPGITVGTQENIVDCLTYQPQPA